MGISSVAGITYQHNLIRNKLGINSLKWSPRLALFSKEWANYLANNNCKMKHRPRSDKYKQKYGENIYWASAISWSGGRKEVSKKIILNSITSKQFIPLSFNCPRAFSLKN